MARSGMSALLTEFRGLAEAGTSEYSVAGPSYWSDDQLQDVLDIHRRDVIFEPLQMYPVQIAGGSIG